jgi:hypothetical protein
MLSVPGETVGFAGCFPRGPVSLLVLKIKGSGWRGLEAISGTFRSRVILSQADRTSCQDRLEKKLVVSGISIIPIRLRWLETDWL